jgi:hypothetical protein
MGDSERRSQVILPEYALKDSVPRGLYGNRSLEQCPVYDKAGGEEVYGEEVNSPCFIVLGNDRVSSKASGKGGQGYTQCSKIDLIAGLNSPEKPNMKKTNPNFFLDAARVYISQKTDVDRNFGLARGTEVGSSNNHSAVAMKADHVRLIGRNHIKIVTGAARSKSAEADSRGDEIVTAGKIDLIAGNSNEPNYVLGAGIGPLQVNAFMSDIQKQTFANKKALLELMTNYVSHVHIQSFPTGLPTLPSPMVWGLSSTITDCFTDLPESFVIESNLASLTENYLTDNVPLYIKSRSVSTT